MNPTALLAIEGTIEIQAAGSPAAGKLPRFKMVANTGTPMSGVEGWPGPVVVDLAGLEIPSQTRPVRFGHDANKGVGHTDSIRVEGSNLVATGVISRATPAAADVAQSGWNGFPWQASINASVRETEQVAAGGSARVNGRSYPGPLTVVRQSRLAEISFCDLGGDQNTTAVVASKGKSMSDASVETNEPDPVVDERERVRAIRLTCGSEHLEIAARACDEGWPIAQVNATVLNAVRASRPAWGGVAPLATGLHARSGYGVSSKDELTASCMLLSSGGGEAIVRHMRNGEQLAGTLARPSGWPELCGRALMLAGIDPPRDRNDLIRAAFSTTDLPVALGLGIQKLALDPFMEMSQTWLGICRIVTATNFREGRAVRLAPGSRLLEVPNDGKIKHGNLGEDAFKFRCKTYGRMFGLTRQDIINDDASILDGVPAVLGSEGARTVSDLFSEVLVGAESSGYFGVSHGNLINASLGLTELGEAVQALRTQKDADNRIIGMTPSVLLVPAALEVTANALIISEELSRVLSGDLLPTGNPLRNAAKVAVEPRLDADSATSWYLTSVPRHGALLAAFLDGRMGVTVERVDTEADMLGINFRAYMDCGISEGDYRAAVKGHKT